MYQEEDEAPQKDRGSGSSLIAREELKILVGGQMRAFIWIFQDQCNKYYRLSGSIFPCSRGSRYKVCLLLGLPFLGRWLLSCVSHDLPHVLIFSEDTSHISLGPTYVGYNVHLYSS